VVRVPGYRSRCPGVDSRRYQIIWEVVGLERGSLSLVNTTEELFRTTSSSSGLEIRQYCRREPSHWPQKLALTSPTSGGRSTGTVRSRTKATELIMRTVKATCSHTWAAINLYHSGDILSIAPGGQNQHPPPPAMYFRVLKLEQFKYRHPETVTLTVCKMALFALNRL
jgi:hypothetical protein